MSYFTMILLGVVVAQSCLIGFLATLCHKYRDDADYWADQWQRESYRARMHMKSCHRTPPLPKEKLGEDDSRARPAPEDNPSMDGDNGTAQPAPSG